MTSFVVDETNEGARLDVVLAAYEGISRSRAAALISAGAVAVNGAVAVKSQILQRGDEVALTAPQEVPGGPPPAVPPIVYRDDDLLVVSKPAGLVVHPGSGHSSDTLVDALRAAGFRLAEGDDPQRPGIVHRLDRDTSGLMVIALSEVARERLVEALAGRTIERRYLALVAGVPAEPRGRVEGPIGRDPDERTRFAVVASGRPAVTRYRVVGSSSVVVRGQRREVSLLCCQLETGRTHQIRVHLAALGHGVIGDSTYGAAGSLAAALGLKRQALHAVALRLRHPSDDRELSFVDAVPDDFAEACHRLGLPVDSSVGVD